MTSSRRFAYVQLDVFTDRPLAGNQLCVFADARALSDEEMQALARETNLSETTFVFPREAAVERERGHKVRIFTTQEELPFAGHPTLGTAFAIHEQTGEELIELDLAAGKIPVRFTRDAEGRTLGEMRQRDPEFGTIHNVADVANATGLPVEAFDSELPIQSVSTGMSFIITPIKRLETMRKLHVDVQRMQAYLDNSDGKFFYFVSRETEDSAATLHARMFFYNGEDPATGSAAGCCAAWAVRHGVLASDAQGMIEQGIEMKRASRILIRATRVGDAVNNVRVGGSTVALMRGELTLG